MAEDMGEQEQLQHRVDKLGSSLADGDAKSDSGTSDDDVEVPEAGWYAKAIAHHPWTTWTCGLLIMFVFGFGGVGITLTAKDFALSGATVGFEARGNDLAGKIISFAHFPREECFGTLSLTADGTQSKYYKWDVQAESDDPAELTTDQCLSGYTSRRRLQEVSKSTHSHTQSLKEDRELSWNEYGTKWDPDLISEPNNNNVLEGNKNGITVMYKGSDLFTSTSLIGMCELDQTFRTQGFGGSYDNVCQTETLNSAVSGDSVTQCVQARSLPNYVAYLANTTSCSAITDADVTTVKALLTRCRTFYDDGSLVPNCWDWNGGFGNNGTFTEKQDTNSKYPSCSLENRVDWECARNNLVYDAFFSLTPTGWDGDSTLESVQSIHSLQNTDNILDTWESNLEGMIGTSNGGAEIFLIYHSDIKGELFSSMMLTESYSFVILFIIVYFLVLFHTGSFWIATCGAVQIFMAFVWGFTLYNVVAWMNFFPFLNLIALFLILGIGADDIFVYVDAWKQSFSTLPRDCPLENRIQFAITRAGGSMLVTTITTCVSFLANITNPITAIKAFGLFTALVVISDFLLMLIFIPSTVAIYHLHFSGVALHVQEGDSKAGMCACHCSGGDKTVKFGEVKGVPVTEVVEQPLGEKHEHHHEYHYHSAGLDDIDEIRASNNACCCRNCCCCVTDCDPDLCAVPTKIDPKTGTYDLRWGEKIFRDHLSPIIFHGIGRYLFLGVCLGLTAWLYTNAAKLSRPTSQYMQLLDAEHPLEVYEKDYQNNFDIKDGNSFDYPYYYVWGLDAIDNGNYFDPAERGSPKYVSIDVTSSNSQQYLLDFCGYIADWDHTQQQGDSLSTNVCGMYWFKNWMEHTCATTGDSGSGEYLTRYPDRTSSQICCSYSTSSFPYSTSVFDTCIAEFANYWGGLSNPYNHGFWFDSSGTLKAVQIIGESNHTYSDVFSVTNTYYQELLSYYDARSDQIGSTHDLGEGWASTELNFYALQEAIVEGAYSSALYSTLFAFLVLIVLTRRILSSIFAAFQITCVVVSVVGVFVMLGWELNVVESIILAVSVGLACDFSAHLAHSFNDNEPKPLEGLTPYSFPTSIAELAQHYLLATQKATGAVTNLGVTIVMGFLSTFCTGVVLTSGALYFFQQFGIFLMALMSFSIVFSFCMLMPILASIGWIDRILSYVGDNSLVKPVMGMMGYAYSPVGAKKVKHAKDADDDLEEKVPVDFTSIKNNTNVPDSTVNGTTTEELAMI